MGEEQPGIEHGGGKSQERETSVSQLASLSLRRGDGAPAIGCHPYARRGAPSHLYEPEPETPASVSISFALTDSSNKEKRGGAGKNGHTTSASVTVTFTSPRLITIKDTPIHHI